MTAVLEPPGVLTEPPLVITEPGIYDIPDHLYHADPVLEGSLSCSGAKQLLDCPAEFRYWQDHPRPYKAEFEVGHAAHLLALGVGPELHVVAGEDWTRAKVREERDAALAAGMVPLLPKEFEQVQAMAAELRKHPRVAQLFGTDGAAEQSLFWRDRETGVMCRARPDWMTPHLLVDYKTTANLADIARLGGNFGYHMQNVWYHTGAVELDLVDPDAEFWFVFQSKNPPYLVRVVDWDEPSLQVGYDRMRQALDVFRDCQETGVWPGYSDDVETISLPRYMLRTSQETW